MTYLVYYIEKCFKHIFCIKLKILCILCLIYPYNITQRQCCCCSVTQSCPTLSIPGTAAHQVPPSSTISQSLLKLMSIESVMPSNHLILCRPLLIWPPVFSSELALHIRWPKYWSFRFSISPSNEYSGLISFRIDWFDLAVHKDPQESSPTPHSEASVLWCSAFFMVQLSHLYMTTGKIIAVTIQSFVGSDVSAF